MSEWNSQLELLIQHFNAMEGWINGALIYAMFQRITVMFLIAFLFSKSKAFELLIKNSMRRRDWLALYVIFTVISMTGSILGDLVILQAENESWQQVKIIHIQPAIFPEEVAISWFTFDNASRKPSYWCRFSWFFRRPAIRFFSRG
jgi:hypothetical protein